MITKKEALDYAVTICKTDGELLVAACIIDNIYNDIENEQNEEGNKDPWAWVKTEYVAMFKNKNPDKGGYIKESVSRMKKMFSENPEIRKEDVLATVKLYLSQTDSRYIRLPHYFLKKGVGVNAVYEFNTWYEKYVDSLEAGKGRSNVINTMQ